MLLEYRDTDNRSDHTGGRHVPMASWFEFAEEQFNLGKTYDMPALEEADE
jgi:hypothetical protein